MLASPTVPLTAGSRIGHYEVTRVLGVGGMGEVYLALDTRLEREVALKILPPHLAGRPSAYERFEREAKALAALDHPNILAIHDFGRDGEIAYVAAELLDGETLAARLEAGALGLRKVVALGLQIARALAAAHDRGIVHRDVKPDNVFVTSSGQIKVLDFGLARYDAPPASSDSQFPTVERHTDPGAVIGTVGYMAPEQVRGERADARSDIFSFGAVLYEMLTGRRAFHRDSAPETMTAILRDDPPPPSSLTPGLFAAHDRIVGRCLEKRPDERFRSAHDVAFALEALADASPAGALALPASRDRRRIQVLWATLALAATAAVFEIGRRVERHGVAATVAPRFRQLTNQPGSKMTPTLSPDGRRFAYSLTDESGQADIHVQRVGGGKPINVTPDSPANDWAPAFSPDGERIAFRSERSREGVFVMGSTGESPRRVTDFGHDPSWSPDGRELVVASAAFLDPLMRSGAGTLWRVDVATGERRQVETGTDAMQPDWSPSGERIAFWSLSEGGQRDIATVSAAGGEVVKLTDDVAADWNPVWSPDGRFVYFSSDRGGTMNLWRIPVDAGSGLARGEPEAVTTPSLWSGWVSLTADGRSLAYLQRDFRTELKLVRLDPRSGRILAEPRSLRSGALRLRDCGLSSDAEWVAFTTHSPREDLFVMRVDGSGFVQLTDDDHRDRHPRWSPDGRRIAFYSSRDGGYQIWTIRPDGSGLTRVSDVPGGVILPVWSPDGARIIATGVTSSSGAADSQSPPLWILDATGVGSATKLPQPDDDGPFWPTSWSREADLIAGFSTAADGNLVSQDIGILDLRDSSWRQVRGYRGPALWYGRRLITFSAETGTSVLVDPDTLASEPFVSEVDVGWMLSAGTPGFSVSDDRRWFAYVTGETASDVWMMDLDPEAAGS